MITGTNSFIGFSSASARNREPIQHALATLLRGNEVVLEVGSGSGQHAVYFSAQWSALRWLPSEVAQQLSLLRANLKAHGGANIAAPLMLDLQNENWAEDIAPVDLIYSANTLHIMGWTEVVSLFHHLDKVLLPEGRVVLYGPFRYKQCFTSASNAEFDRWLKDRHPASGIRDFEAVDALARKAGLSLLCDIEMPANNQLLVWQKS